MSITRWEECVKAVSELEAALKKLKDCFKISDPPEEVSTITVENYRIPKGAKLIEAYETKTEYVIMGDPSGEEEESPNAHNCDLMGCGSLGHVVARFKKHE